MLIRLLLLIIIVVGGLVLLAGQWGFFQGQAPQDLGVRDGKLKPPSTLDNSVSSQALLYPEHLMSSRAQIAPLSYSVDGQVAWRMLERVVSQLPRTSIITNESSPAPAGGRYLYAQCTSLLLRFTDDLEFWQDEPAKLIHVRSASRLGRKDFGVNRARVERIRSALAGLI